MYILYVTMVYNRISWLCRFWLVNQMLFIILSIVCAIYSISNSIFFTVLCDSDFFIIIVYIHCYYFLIVLLIIIIVIIFTLSYLWLLFLLFWVGISYANWNNVFWLAVYEMWLNISIKRYMMVMIIRNIDYSTR